MNHFKKHTNRLKSILLRATILWLGIFLIHSLSAQSNAVFNISRADGLPSNTVFDVFQSKDGFVWIATQNGLVRYNGYSFRSYANKNVRSRAVSNICEDIYGTIWLKSFFGEILYIKNDSLHILKEWEDKYDSGFPVINTKGDTLFITIAKRAYLFSISNKEFIKEYNLEADLTSNSKVDAKIWKITHANDSLFASNIINPDERYGARSTKKIGMVPADMDKETWFFSAETGQILQGTIDNGLQDLSSKFQSISGDIRSIIQSKNGKVSFSGTNGFYLLDDKLDSWKHYLPGKNVSSLIPLQEGGYLVATLNEGLFYMPVLDSYLIPGNFIEIAYNPLEKEIVGGDFTGGLTFVNKDAVVTNTVSPIFPREVQSLYVDIVSNQYLYYTNSLYRYDKNTDKVIHDLRLNASKDITSYGGRFYIAASGGLFVLNNGNIEHHYLQTIRSTTLCIDALEKKLWVGTQSGLYSLDLKNADAEPVLFEFANDISLGITSLAYHEGGIMVGTSSNGLFKIKNNEIVNHFTLEDGLPSENITALFADDKIWIGTDKGLALCDYSVEGIQVIDKTKGLIAEEIYDLEVRDGSIWVVHNLGIQKLPTNILRNKITPNLVFSDLAVDNQYVNSQTTVVMQPRDVQLSIYFDVANNIRSRGKTKIFYRIKELNRDNWNKTDLLNPVANFLTLKPGEYTLEAYAQNEDLVQSKVISLPIEVLAPFYRETWFLILTTVIICLLIGFIFFIRLKVVNQRNKEKLILKAKEQELKIAQLTSIRAQMNPHFIFNTMSLIQGRVINGMPEKASKLIQDFSKLMRRILDFSQQEMVMLSSEIEVVDRYLAIEKERSDGKLDYTIEVGEGVEDEMIEVPSLITQPFVENALKHGLLHKDGDQKLKVAFTLEDNTLKIIVEDNGIGRAAAAEINKQRSKGHKSFALNAFNKRIKLFNESRPEKITLETIDLTNEDGDARGTRVIINMQFSV